MELQNHDNLIRSILVHLQFVQYATMRLPSQLFSVQCSGFFLQGLTWPAYDLLSFALSLLSVFTSIVKHVL